MDFLTRLVAEPSPLGEYHPWCSMTPTTNKIDGKEHIFPMELYNLSRHGIYNDQPAEKKTNMRNIST